MQIEHELQSILTVICPEFKGMSMYLYRVPNTSQSFVPSSILFFSEVATKSLTMIKTGLRKLLHANSWMEQGTATGYLPTDDVI